MSMQEAIQIYFSEVQEQFNSGQAIEHAYRPALQRLMSSFDDIIAVNDPRHSEHGAPDFVFIQKSNQKIFRGYAEAKDIGINLDKVEKSNQMERYSGYDNLFLTDYLEFRFFKNGEKFQTISLGSIKNDQLHLTPDTASFLYDELRSFLQGAPERIRSGKRLAVMMGGYARRIRGNVTRFLSTENNKNESLEKIYAKMKELLVHDLTLEKFADMYAQTLVYGLFVGRYNDASLDDFTRQEAQQNIPRSNPFLRQFFDHIAGIDFDERLAVVVDELCAVFAVSDVRTIIEKHLRLFEVENDRDPLIHFYEDFLKEYDPALRKSMGAYYTPTPVVKFIIREVDLILKEDFSIRDGIASSEMIEREVATQPWRLPGERKDRLTKTVKTHRVQILDPAVGTATFLNETIKFIYDQKRKTQAGQWPSYVREHLVPRLFGFELMMAPYTIAHLKLGMTLHEQGVTDLGDERLNIYLTNTLEEGTPAQHSFDFGFSEAISTESRLAADIKTTQPIMIVMGNPPYSGVSSNETKYANSIIQKYKVEPGGQQKLQERKHWLNDDYVKFIAFAEEMIEKNDTGIVAMITNNGYLDNPTFRGMRWHLAKTFDKIYVLDLHGNAKKKETTPNGSKDENVFDIMQGVGIILAVKTGNKTDELAQIYHADLFGKRRAKFDALAENIKFTRINPDAKNVYFVPKSTEGQEIYERGVKIDKLFVQNVAGIVTMGDNFIVNKRKSVITERLQRLSRGEYGEDELNKEFGLGKNYAKFVLSNASELEFNEAMLVRIAYRPFDTRWTYFDNKVLWRWREKVMKNFINNKNLGLIFERSVTDQIFIVDGIVEHAYLGTAGFAGNTVPLYIYHEDGTRTPNFDADELKKLTVNLSSDYSPEDILDYIYAALHSPSYRAKYKGFLKIDFPRVPVPTQDDFDRLVSLGRKLRELHLMKSATEYDTTFPEAGGNMVEQLKYSEGKVWINGSQYFGNVPELAWSFYVGGYQPAQKWLKDRKGRRLSSDDIDHYQKIIKILIETDRIMKEIG